MAEMLRFNSFKSYGVLLLSILLAQSAGLIGSLATRPNIDTWYRAIEKPAFTPPDWIFPVVWPSLFLLMGIAAWLIYRSPERRSRSFLAGVASPGCMLLPNRSLRAMALLVYGIHLIFNTLWSFLFFGLQMPGLAFLEILVLLALILYTTRLFYLIRPSAGYLMVPYILWVSYATVLNGTIWWMNM